jgi:hypothetical protein
MQQPKCLLDPDLEASFSTEDQGALVEVFSPYKIITIYSDAMAPLRHAKVEGSSCTIVMDYKPSGKENLLNS